MIPLFERYPGMKDKLDHVPLGSFPTPVESLERLGREIGVNDLYVKRDDLSGEAYAGNKVRKLEFVLARVLAKGAKEVLTFGYAGSNHATATAVYAEQLGLRSISMLLPQPNADYVRRNLLLSYRCNAELHQKKQHTPPGQGYGFSASAPQAQIRVFSGGHTGWRFLSIRHDWPRERCLRIERPDRKR